MIDTCIQNFIEKHKTTFTGITVGIWPNLDEPYPEVREHVKIFYEKLTGKNLVDFTNTKDGILYNIYTNSEMNHTLKRYKCSDELLTKIYKNKYWKEYTLDYNIIDIKLLVICDYTQLAKDHGTDILIELYNSGIPVTEEYFMSFQN